MSQQTLDLILAVLSGLIGVAAHWRIRAQSKKPKPVNGVRK